MRGNEKKNVAALCTNIMSLCPIHYFLITPAQLREPKTLLNLWQQCFFYTHSPISLASSAKSANVVFGIVSEQRWETAVATVAN